VTSIDKSSSKLAAPRARMPFDRTGNGARAAWTTGNDGYELRGSNIELSGCVISQRRREEVELGWWRQIDRQLRIRCREPPMIMPVFMSPIGP
jgi:hypothetical protein